MNIQSACGLRSATASNMSAADTTGTTSTKGGGSMAVGPEISVTSAPRSMAILARA